MEEESFSKIMETIRYIDRQTGNVCEEEVYGQKALHLLYGNSLWGQILRELVAKYGWISSVYGWMQKSPFSKRKIRPFIDRFGVDAKEFLDPISSFSSFNDFFIRKLQPNTRPISAAGAVMPADGRYRFFQQIHKGDQWDIKGQKLSLEELIGDSELAQKFVGGTMIIARLCPVDYHRFHFPCEGIASHPKLINGSLYSVNPVALDQNIGYLSKNKRMITEMETLQFGKMLYIEVGATFVGSIHQTFDSNHAVQKGQEKGYFSFGGSMLVLLFQEGAFQLASDLPVASELETLCKVGQPLSASHLS